MLQNRDIEQSYHLKLIVAHPEQRLICTILSNVRKAETFYHTSLVSTQACRLVHLCLSVLVYKAKRLNL